MNPITASRHQLTSPATLSKEKLTSSKHNVVKTQNVPSTLRINRSGLQNTLSKQASILYTGSRRATIARISSKMNTAPRIRDNTGNEITPQSLQMNPDPNVGMKTSTHTEATQMLGEALYLQSIYNPQEGGTTNKLAYKGSVYGATSSVNEGTPAFNDSYYGDDLAGKIQTALPGTATTVQMIQDEVEEQLTKEDLEKNVDIFLNESDSFWLFDMVPHVFSTESEEANQIQEANEKYLELKKNREGNDRYVSRNMQTFNYSLKDKSFQTTPITTQNIGVLATTWDYYDQFERVRLIEEEQAELAASVIPSLVGSGAASMVASRAASKQAHSRPSLLSSRAPSVLDKAQVAAAGSMSQLSSTLLESNALVQSTMPNGAKQPGVDFSNKPVDSTAQAHLQALHILESDSMKNSMSVMEKAVMLNSYQPRQAIFRDLTELPAKRNEETRSSVEANQNLPDSLGISQLSRPRTRDRPRPEDVTPRLDLLWTYKCDLVADFTPLCIEFNKENTDIIAVGYVSSQPNQDNQHSGLICCWSIKNPQFPERTYRSDAGICSLSFSSVHPSILAAGLTNGIIAIYNIRKTDPEPAIDSSTSPAKHTGAVWQVEWVERETVSGEEKSEFLVSSSEDGRISQWTIRKGFECTELMSLKRSISKQGDKKGAGRNKQSSALISRYTPGLSFAFSKESSNIYLAGTEDGLIHRCSCSYTEQYLKSFEGHTGPVSHIKWCPSEPEYFLTCSSDWSLRIWHNSTPLPIFNFSHLQEDIFDIHWSPTRPTVFASITSSSLELWDLAISALDPIYSSKPIDQNAGISCFNFALNSECIMLGDSTGSLHVFKMQRMPPVQTVEVLLKALTGIESDEAY